MAWVGKSADEINIYDVNSNERVIIGKSSAYTRDLGNNIERG